MAHLFATTGAQRRPDVETFQTIEDYQFWGSHLTEKPAWNDFLWLGRGVYFYLLVERPSHHFGDKIQVAQGLRRRSFRLPDQPQRLRFVYQRKQIARTKIRGSVG